jgi:hypothetical protein
MTTKKTRAQLIAEWELQRLAETHAQAARGRAYLAELSESAVRWNVTDPCIFITCGHCQQVAPAEAWTRREIAGDLPPSEYQCPNCGRAFRRRASPRLVHLDPIPTRL